MMTMVMMMKMMVDDDKMVKSGNSFLTNLKCYPIMSSVEGHHPVLHSLYTKIFPVYLIL